MTFSLPPLAAAVPIVDANGRPSNQFIRFWQSVTSLIAAQENSQNTTLANLKRLTSHTSPTTIVHAADAGATATITIDGHTRVYGDGTTLALAGAVHPGLVSATTYAIYYDDPTLLLATPTYLFTTTLATAQAAAAEGRHFLGIITTPAAGSGLTIDGGGVYAVGSNVGGEL